MKNSSQDRHTPHPVALLMVLCLVAVVAHQLLLSAGLIGPERPEYTLEPLPETVEVTPNAETSCATKVRVIPREGKYNIFGRFNEPIGEGLEAPFWVLEDEFEVDLVTVGPDIDPIKIMASYRDEPGAPSTTYFRVIQDCAVLQTWTLVLDLSNGTISTDGEHFSVPPECEYAAEHSSAALCGVGW